MLVAQYMGRSLVPSRAIRWITRGPYSHTALLLDGAASRAACRLVGRGVDLGRLDCIAPGSVVEAWVPEVRAVPSLSAQHDPGTRVDVFEPAEPLRPSEEEELVLALAGEIGTPYDVRDVLRFVTRRPGRLDRTWFCSELAFWAFLRAGRRLLAETQAWEVHPNLIQRSPLLRRRQTVHTAGPDGEIDDLDLD